MTPKAPNNKTLSCSDAEVAGLSKKLIRVKSGSTVESLTNRIIHQDFFKAAKLLPDSFVDLMIIDPPYNLRKDYNGTLFRSKQADEYIEWFEGFVSLLPRLLKANATIYVCSDWRSSTLIFPVLDKYFKVRNRITWEREKGRGAKANWKNNTEDIWFCTASDDYVFDVDAVKLKRKVIAPYRTEKKKPKDWEETAAGNFRLTHPSNVWTDISVPFWSMPENTDHPTQKPEKLIAKLILASSREGDFVFDPFLGSGTTAVVAKKLGRLYSGVEQNREYCCWAEKRLAKADDETGIQGYADGVFWERNTHAAQQKKV